MRGHINYLKMVGVQYMHVNVQVQSWLPFAARCRG